MKRPRRTTSRRHRGRRSSDTPNPESTLPGRLLSAALVAGEAAIAASLRAERAESQLKWSDYVIDLDERLTASVEAVPTHVTIAQVAFPEPDAWAIVDLETAEGMTRLAIVHPDPAKAEMAALLNTRWIPQQGDLIGLPAAKVARAAVAITQGLDAVLAGAAHTSANLDLIRAMGFEACLVVPIITDDVVEGSITFVSAHPRVSYTAEELTVGAQIARASSKALRSVRLFASVDAQRAAAEESNRSRIDALGRVTHELRTPLNAIGGYAELLTLGDHGALTPAQQNDIERIRWNQHYLLTLITDILSYVRVDARRVDFIISDIDLHQVGADAAGMLEPLFMKKRQRVGVAAPSAPVLARGDPARVQQIILNVLTNAHKYSPVGADIQMECGAEPPNVFVDIADGGPGIPMEQCEAIFEPFVQLPGGETARQGGVGLGLAIARELARGMSGDLAVRPRPEGGAIFRLWLPQGHRGSE